MLRVRTSAASRRPDRRSYLARAAGASLLLVIVAAGLVHAASVTVGYRDFTYDGGLASRSTADSPQSKLWFAGGTWWGGLFKSGTGSNQSRYHIWQLNSSTHAWTDTNITVDPRDKTHADYYFDSARNKLYVTSTKTACTSNPAAPKPPCNDALRVYRFSYVPANPLSTRWVLDSGFPFALFGGAFVPPGPSAGGADTATIARDSLGRVYVVWTRGEVTSYAYSTSDGDPATVADEAAPWSAPVVLNAGEAGQTNISGALAFGSSLGIYYTDRHASGDDIGNFAVRAAADDPATFATQTVVSSTAAVDDQANVKADAAGNVYLVVKTQLSGASSDQIRLYKRSSGGTWDGGHGVSTVSSGNTRPQVAIHPTFDGGVGLALVVMSNTNDGQIYYKTAPLTGAGALTFAPDGAGQAFIKSATDTNIFDPTTTKQVLTGASGFVAEASDRTTFYYLHNELSLPDAADSTGPTGTVAINGNPSPDATTVTGVTLTVPATDPSGVISARISNSVDGTTCPTSGSPAVLTGGSTIAYLPGTVAWTLSSGDGTKRVCAQWLDNAGNWSTPVSDTIVLDTTAPVGTVTINGGDASTPIGAVSVAVPATDATSVTNVRLSNDPTTSGGILSTGTTFAYGTPQSWTLLPGDGSKAVYVQWRDALGFWSGVSSDTIVLDSVNTTYTAIDPVRLLDSRPQFNNPAGITIFTHHVPQSFQITGRAGIPDNAVAITANLTVTGQQAPGFVTLGPDVSPTPTTSTINFPKGDNRANGVFVPLDSLGRLEATYHADGTGAATKKTHLVLDVTGYFVAGTTGAEYFTVTPTRYLDTRASNPAGAVKLRPGVPYGFQVGGRTVGSTTVPPRAVAITGNLTVTGQTTGGFLSLTPTAQPNPTTSTLNFPIDDTRANNVTVKLGANGTLYVVYKGGTGRAHAILDVTGYFLDDGAGLSFVPLTPTRTVDTRIDFGIFNPLQANASKSWTVRGVAGVETDAGAFTGNVTVVGQTRAGYVSVTPRPTNTPSTSTLNFPLGDVRANGVASPIDGGTGKSSAVFKASSGKTEFIVDVTGYFH